MRKKLAILLPLLALSGLIACTTASLVGCRSNQTSRIMGEAEGNMVDSHQAGAGVYDSGVVSKVVDGAARQHFTACQPLGLVHINPANGISDRRVVFLGVENHGIEEMGDWRGQINTQITNDLRRYYTVIDQQYVNAGLQECGLRLQDLHLPQNQQRFIAAMASPRVGMPIDCLASARIDTGSTQNNDKAYQRNYNLTVKLVELKPQLAGASYGHTEAMRKDYNRSAMAKIKDYNPF